MSEEELKKIYYNPETGYQSANKLYKKIHNEHPKVTLKQVQNFINKQYTAQVNRQEKKPKEFSSIVAAGPRNNYQVDIIVYDRYEYNHYKYILCVIDVYSRYAAVRAMTNRELPTIIEKFEDIMNEMGYPKNLNADNEFNKKAFNDLMKEHNVQTWYSEVGEINKNSIVERFNRTIAGLLQKWRVATNKHDWPKVIQKLVKNYNNTEHRTIKNTPNNVFHEDGVNWQKPVVLENDLKVGDQVRVKQIKNVFSKGDMIKYSKDLYRIREIVGKKIYLTNLSTNEDLDKFFREYQLKPVNEIQYLSESEDDGEEEKVHETQVKEKKVKRQIRKEGIEDTPIVTGKRERQPRYIDYFVSDY